jgi:predicted AAA+ superfamily ATPase
MYQEVITYTSTEEFLKLDYHLRNLSKQQFIFKSNLIDLLPTQEPGIYTIGGGRQIGKTTLLKQWMLHLMQSGITPQNILFLTGEVIDDHHKLISILNNHLPDSLDLKYIIIDEVTYIRDWDKAIKFLADNGSFEKCIVVITGSDLLLMQQARLRFPGRRGKSSQVDFHYYSLSFREFVHLKYGIDDKSGEIDLLFRAFDEYLSHGGFLTAINDIASRGEVLQATFRTYSDWIRADAIRGGKNEHNLRDFLNGMLLTYGTQVTWHSLSQHLSIEHPKTTQDYAEILQSMDAIFIQHAIIEHKLTNAPKKAKRLFFTDPFIYHSIRNWLKPGSTIANNLSDASVLSSLVETCVISHIRRKYTTYFIKATGEVDVAYIKNDTFYPIEVKWTKQIRKTDLKQVLKYPNAAIWAKQRNVGTFEHLNVVPLPLALYSENY